MDRSEQFVSRVTLQRDRVESLERYPFSLPALRHFHELDLHPEMTIFVGENGSGKSTFLEALAVSLGFNPEGGTKSFNFRTRESHSKLHEFLRIRKGPIRPRTGFFLRAESFFNLATEIEVLDRGEGGGLPIIHYYGGQSLHEQSHGESFLALMMHKFSKNGLYLLDEPESPLSPQRQLSVIAIMHDLILRGSQFIMATHSPILMAYPGATIYEFSSDGIKPIEYEETEHYQITRAFLSHHERMLQEILGASVDGPGKAQKPPKRGTRSRPSRD